MPGDSVVLAFRVLGADGVAMPAVPVTLARTVAGGIAMQRASGQTLVLQGVGVTEDTIEVTAAGGGGTATLRLPLRVLPPPDAVLQVVGGTTLQVDSAERRVDVLRLVRGASATPVPFAAGLRGLVVQDSVRLQVQLGTSAGGLTVVGGQPGTGRVTLALGATPLGTVSVDVAPTWTWRSVAGWSRLQGSATTVVPTFLGVGARDSLLYEGPRDGSTPPRLVPGLPKVLEVSSGNSTACVLAVDGRVWCRGYNLVGEVGRPDAPVGAAAIDVPWGPVATTERFVTVATHTNGTLALTADGRWFGWGFTPAGRLAQVPSVQCATVPLGACAPMPVLPTRRFDRVTSFWAQCARERGTGDWYCGGGTFRLRNDLTGGEIVAAESTTVVRLPGRGGLDYVIGGNQGWFARTSDGRAWVWQSSGLNAARIAAGLPATLDTVEVTPGTTYSNAPTRRAAVRNDGALVVWPADRLFIGATSRVAPRPVVPSPTGQTAFEPCFRYADVAQAVCLDDIITRAQPVPYDIPRPARVP